MRAIITLGLAAALCGCSTTAPEPVKPAAIHTPTAKQFEQLYLRGTFSLWGYKEEFKLQKVSSKLYSAAASLNEGETYEFMFSAKDASKRYANCGYLNPKEQKVVVGKTVKASCEGMVLQNFVFKAIVSGVYEFFIDFNELDKPKVFIKKAY